MDRTGLHKPALPPRTKCAPPPLPARKPSSLALTPPALPHRNSSDSCQSVQSPNSCSSVASESTISSPQPSSKHILRAPAWNEAELPPLPPKVPKGAHLHNRGHDSRLTKKPSVNRFVPSDSPMKHVTILAQLHEKKSAGGQTKIRPIKAPPPYKWKTENGATSPPPPLPARSQSSEAVKKPLLSRQQKTGNAPFVPRNMPPLPSHFIESPPTVLEPQRFLVHKTSFSATSAPPPVPIASRPVYRP